MEKQLLQKNLVAWILPRNSSKNTDGLKVSFKINIKFTLRSYELHMNYTVLVVRDMRLTSPRGRSFKSV